MKFNSEVGNVSGEAVCAVGKATELFIQFLVRNTYDICQLNTRKSIKLEDMLVVTQCSKFRRKLEFLDDAFGPLH